MSKETNKTKLELGTDLFENYINAKKALTSRIKAVLDIMAKCNSLDVEPEDAAKWVARETTKTSSHQWRYSAGHETIYCEHSYDFRGSFHNKCTVKIPVRFLGMTDEEIYAANRDAAIASLEHAKEDLDKELNRVTDPINKKKAKLDEKIAALREGKIE